jgi:hypothetical protein
MSNVGILAYGSLIKNPGREIEPMIKERISTQTPFPVEYGRLSTSRGGGPTVVPHPVGQPVKAQVLVLKECVSLLEAKDLLWRRETRQECSGKQYRPGTSPNSVLVRVWPRFEGVEHVLYTDFPDAGKIPAPDAILLARAAIKSISRVAAGKDGISYLIQVSESDVVTPLTARYQEEILRLTSANSLQEAITILQRGV